MTDPTKAAQEIAGMIKMSMSRRRVLQAAGISGAALAAAACGTGGDASGEAATQEDRSDSALRVNW